MLLLTITENPNPLSEAKNNWGYGVVAFKIAPKIAKNIYINVFEHSISVICSILH